MNRDIELRAWDKDSEAMVEQVWIAPVWLPIPSDKTRVVLYVYKGYADRPQMMGPYRDIPVMEYTDRKDKNGVKIFEGDRVKRQINMGTDAQPEYEEFVGIVKLGPKGWYLDCRVPEQWVGEYHIKRGTLSWSRIRNEVIGNIHENPEGGAGDEKEAISSD